MNPIVLAVAGIGLVSGAALGGAVLLTSGPFAGNGPTASDAGPQAAQLTILASERQRPGHPYTGLTEHALGPAAVAALREVAFSHARVTDWLAMSQDWELIEATPSPRFGEKLDPHCPRYESCRALIFYAWDRREALTVDILPPATIVQILNGTGDSGLLTEPIEEQASAIAVADDRVRQLAQGRPIPIAVVHYIRPKAGDNGVCTRDWCVGVTVATAPNAVFATILVDLNLSRVVWIVAAGQVVYDGRAQGAQ